jgi:hypothetical protein
VAAQTLVGRLLDQATGDPLEGAFVVLVDAGGAQRGGFLTNEEGRYILRAPGPGRYTLRAERIGYSSHTSEPVELASNETRIYDMAVSTRVIALESIRVEGEQRCTVRPGSAARTADVWEAAGNALRLAAWTGTSAAVRYRAIDFQREIEARTNRVLSETRTPRSIYTSGSLYESVPADELAERGYVRPEEENTWEYFAPDAQVLLSDSFLDGHCFALTEEDSRPELIGLAFRPLDGTDRPDIEGVLWLDRQSSELRYLEFRYTTLPYPVRSRDIGGRVDFERLDGGPWIVRSWSIRMPRVEGQRLRFGTRYSLSGFIEVGGEVTEVRRNQTDRRLGETEVGGSVAGVVLDRAGRGAVADAEVSVVGTVRSARTDGGGRFRVNGLPDGRYGLRVTPPAWDLPWLLPEAGDVVVREGATSNVELRLLTPDRILRAICDQLAPDAPVGVVVGRVTDAATGQPVADGGVVVAWASFGLGEDLTGVEVRTLWDASTGTTDDGGWFRVCGVPEDVLLRVMAVPSGDSAERTSARLWTADAPAPTGAREIWLSGIDPVGRVDLTRRAGGQAPRARP